LPRQHFHRFHDPDFGPTCRRLGPARAPTSDRPAPTAGRRSRAATAPPRSEAPRIWLQGGVKSRSPIGALTRALQLALSTVASPEFCPVIAKDAKRPRCFDTARPWVHGGRYSGRDTQAASHCWTSQRVVPARRSTYYLASIRRTFFPGAASTSTYLTLRRLGIFS
jgi:hypothetical protein